MRCPQGKQRKKKTRNNTHPPGGDCPSFGERASVIWCQSTPTQVFTLLFFDRATGLRRRLVSFFAFAFYEDFDQMRRGENSPLFFSAVGCDKKRGRREGRRKKLKSAITSSPQQRQQQQQTVCVCGPQEIARSPAVPPRKCAEKGGKKEREGRENTEQPLVKPAMVN